MSEAFAVIVKKIIESAFEVALGVELPAKPGHWTPVEGLGVTMMLESFTRTLPESKHPVLRVVLMVADRSNSELSYNPKSIRYYTGLILLDATNPEKLVSETKNVSFQMLSMFFDSLLPEDRRMYKLLPDEYYLPPSKESIAS